MKSLACSAQSFGYGPAAKLILLGQSLRDCGFHLTFLGKGIAFELVSRSSIFHEVIDASPNDRRVSSFLKSCCGLLSVMDRDYATLALDLSRPLYIADSLAWMRKQFPAPFRMARRYWVQRFDAFGQHSTALPSNARVVGPIVQSRATPLDRTPPKMRQGHLIVNVGGGESPHGQLSEKTAYIDFVIRGIIESSLTLKSACFDGIKFVAGGRCIDYLRQNYSRTGIEFCSVSHRESQQLFSSAAWVLTSPGLTTSLECFQLGVPTFFLPPQNYSQWRILQTFRRHELAPTSFHWEDLDHDGPSPVDLSEGERTPQVSLIIEKCAKEQSAFQLFQKSLRDSLASPQDELSHNQQRYFASLGENGVEQIVKELVEMC